MNSAFFNRFFITTVLTYLIVIALFLARHIAAITTDINFSIFNTANLLSLISVFAFCTAVSRKTTDEAGFKLGRLVPIVFAGLTALYVFSLLGPDFVSNLTFIFGQASVILITVLTVTGQLRQKTSWLENGFTVSFFYLLMLFNLMVGLLSVTAGDYGFLLYEDGLTFVSLNIIVLLVFALTLMIFAAVYYWKRVKMISVIIILPIAGLVGVVYYNLGLADVLYDRFSVISLPLYPEDAEVTEDYGFPSEEYSDESEEEESEIIEGEDGNVEAFSLDFLWKHPEAHRDSMEYAVHYFDRYKIQGPHEIISFTPEYYQKKGFTDGVQTDEDEVWDKPGKRAFSILMAYLENNRRSSNLKGMFNVYQPVIKYVVSVKEYERKYKETVDLLLVAYDDINDDASFISIYNFMKDNPEDQEEHIEFITDYMSSYGYYNFFIKYNSSPYRLVYYYSFWGRRMNEGNITACADILREIQSMYADEEEANSY